MKNTMTSKAVLLGAFVAAVAGCNVDAQNTKAAEGLIFDGNFTFDTQGKVTTLKDQAKTVVFDFNTHTMAVKNNVGNVLYTKNTNGPLSKHEETLALFAEATVCFNMNKDANDKILLDPKVDSITHDRGCADNGGIGRVTYAPAKATI